MEKELQAYPLEIFFDGNCVVCSMEMSLYRRKVKQHKLSEKVLFVDISSPTFQATLHSLDPKTVNQVMHVKRGPKVYQGVKAFQEIWRTLPGYQLLLRFSENILLYPFMELGYQIFVKIRPYLPKKKKLNV